jgi:hypothetical protein
MKRRIALLASLVLTAWTPLPWFGATSVVAATRQSEAAWNRARKINTPSAYREYLGAFPSGGHRAEAMKCMREPASCGMAVPRRIPAVAPPVAPRRASPPPVQRRRSQPSPY